MDAIDGVADCPPMSVDVDDGFDAVEPPDPGGSCWRARSGIDVYAELQVSRVLSPVSVRGNGRGFGPPLFGAVAL